MVIGERIKEARLRCGLSQRDLARACRVTPGIISHWETGVRTPGRDNLLRIAAATSTNISELMAPEEAPEKGTLTNLTQDEVAMLRGYRRLSERQRKNLVELISVSGDVRREIEQQAKPAHRLKAIV
jgi:transcriptional regulator with XRE-family HTH domain